MSEEVTKEQTKGADQEKITELSDEQLAAAQGGVGKYNAIAIQGIDSDGDNVLRRDLSKGFVIDGMCADGDE